MTLAITVAAQGLIDLPTRDEASRFQKLAFAIAGTRAQKQTALNELFDQPDFTFEATTTTNDAVTLANAGVNLVTKGVTFPAGALRKITLRYSYAQSATVKGYASRDFVVVGAANTPILAIAPTDLTYSPTGVGIIGGNPAVADGRYSVSIPVGTAGLPLWPDAQVKITATPAVDQPYVGVLGISAVPLRWRVDVYVGKLIVLAVP